ncbi:LCP family protein [Paenibacillus humicola]|uniref:LCP family protein n=1 Tax=Paenibacillus humicola TaxID=3110540 RepID=UPI00237B2A22|nr:LCP family protein [Paenibacillus humicola]
MSRTEDRMKKPKKPWKWVMLGVSAVLLCIVGYFVYQAVGVYNGLNNLSDPGKSTQIPIKSFPEDTQKNLQPTEWTGKERVNILLMGGDNRGLKENESARSDSMLVVSFDPVTKEAHLFSVLRDTYIPIEGHGEGRINTAMALGGPNLAMKTIGDLLGLNIQYYVYTDFEGFKSLIDAIGGIDFDVEKDMNYVDNADKNRYDIHLKKGMQHLDGTHALMYVRFRHDAMSDFTRTERQRNFLSAVADKLKSGWNLVRAKQILDSISPYIKTNIEVSDMLKLAQLGVESHLAGTAQMPPMDLLGSKNADGASVLTVRDPEELKQYVQQQLALDQTQKTPAGGSGSAAGTDGTGGSNSASGTADRSGTGGSGSGSDVSSSSSSADSGSER